MPAGLDKDDWSDSDYDLTEDDDESDSSGNGSRIFFQPSHFAFMIRGILNLKS